jgi:hypothetical protein
MPMAGHLVGFTNTAGTRWIAQVGPEIVIAARLVKRFSSWPTYLSPGRPTGSARPGARVRYYVDSKTSTKRSLHL